MTNIKDALHLNYSIITQNIESGAKILDLGCGEGDLLKMLIDEKNCTGSGIEINQQNVIKSIQKGLSIVQGDIDEGLKEFSENEYDYVILNQTLQSTEKPDYVIEEMLRVGKKVVVSFPNFGYWRVRFYLFFRGRMPKSKMLPFCWYDTPNIHLLTVNDFFDFCKDRKIDIQKSVYIKRGCISKNPLTKFLTNFLCEEAVFIIKR
ncbi:MAG: methionine biosynthesis protein MetW [Clostridium sp.]|nr:methionine biosynthesis protein MetW [Clostridium sp.]